MSIATIDFETFSEADLKEVGGWKYSEHPSTIVMCLVYKLPSGESGVWDTFYEDLNDISDIDPLFSWIKSGGLVEAHNAGFEEAIWINVCVKKYGFPEVPSSQWRCSAAKAAASGLPRSLGQLGKALNTDKQKDEDGRKVMLKMSKPRKPSKNDPSTRHMKAEDIDTLLSYCVDDVETEEACSHAIPDLSDTELNVWQLTQEVNRRGLFIDIPNVKKAISYIERFSVSLTEELEELTNGEIKTANQHAKIKKYCHDNGYEIAGTSKEYVEDALDDDLIPDNVRRVLEIRQALGSAAVKKFKKMLDSTCSDSRIRGSLIYHGAATGRFSSTGVQFQNLPRGTIKDVDKCIEVLDKSTYREFIEAYPDVLGALASCIRGMIKAPEGKIFYCADFSSIECRTLFWLAECETGLDIYRKDGKVYEDMAAYIYNIGINDVNKDQRQVGKQAILGLGYQMGAGTFIKTCESYKMSMPEPLAKKAVTAYRDRYPEIKSLWYETEAAALKAVRNPGKIVRQNSKIAWLVKGDFLYCRIPSGRKLAYYKPVIVKSKTSWGEIKDQISFYHLDSVTRKYRRIKIYGGKLVQNINQALARDVMVNSMFNLDAEGYKQVLNVHDELLSEAPEDFGSLEEYEKIMATPPKWALDLPIEVEGYVGKRFKK